jgi:hypothetical protein
MKFGTVSAEKNHAGDRFVVSIRMTGLGDRLASLAAAWRYARDTGRTLVSHWRFGNLSPDSMKNVFLLCFQDTPDLAGVPFVAVDDINAVQLPRPRYPAIWDTDALVELPFLRPTASFAANQADAIELIRSGTDLSAKTVIFDGCVHDGLVSLEEARTFLSALRPVRNVQDAINSFCERNKRVPLIGLHVRHGNGGEIMAHAPFWKSFGCAIDRCARAIQHARASILPDAPVLLCTDSIEVRDALVTSVPRVITRHKHFGAPGEGSLHCVGDAWRYRDDALVELLLLAQCSVVIRYPPGSFFSFYGAVMRSPPGPISRTVYDLHRPWDDKDQLSPSIIF